MNTFKTKLALAALALTFASAAEAAWTNCKPTGVAVFAQRLHVRCAVPVSGISYFALATNAGSDYYKGTLAVANTSLVAGKTLRIMYDPADTSGTAFGCQANDCRKLQGLEMME